ncbi:MAG: hypothetical protein Q9209_005027 [Squamulea sp. 1 TL-2023]
MTPSPCSPGPYEPHDTPRGQWKVQQIKKTLGCRSNGEYRGLYVELESIMRKHGLIGEQFGPLKNKQKLEALFPKISISANPEGSTMPYSRRLKALTQLAHKINSNAGKKATRNQRKQRTRRYYEAAAGSSDTSTDVPEESEKFIGRSHLVLGDMVLKSVREDNMRETTCRLKSIRQRSEAADITGLDDLSWDQWCRRMNDCGILQSPTDTIVHYSRTNHRDVIIDEEAFRSRIQFEFSTGQEVITFMIESGTSGSTKRQLIHLRTLTGRPGSADNGDTTSN